MKLFFAASLLVFGSNVFAAVVDPCEQNMPLAALLLQTEVSQVTTTPVRLQTTSSFSHTTKSGDVVLVVDAKLKNQDKNVDAGGLFECNAQTGEYEFKRMIYVR